jgi:hypothetical protein
MHLQHLRVMDCQRAMVHLRQLVMEVRPAMERGRVGLAHNHQSTINLQLTMMEEILEMVMVH